MVDRRTLIAAAVGLVAGRPRAQPRRLRLAFFSEGTLATHRPYLDALRAGLRELGRVEGADLAIETHWGADTLKSLGWMAVEIVDGAPDVIVTTCAFTTRAALKATRTLPVVFVIGSDPVALGYAASLARPGGNATGIGMQHVEVSAKRLQLLKEAAPRVTRVGVLYASEDPSSTGPLHDTAAAAPRLGLQLTPAIAWSRRELLEAFDRLRDERVEALFDLNGLSINFEQRRLFAELALRARWPSMCFAGEFVDDGGLMSYGPNDVDMFRHAATFVDKIARGARPAELPVEQPTRFELACNLTTARALGLTLPQAILARADRVVG